MTTRCAGSAGRAPRRARPAARRRAASPRGPERRRVGGESRHTPREVGAGRPSERLRARGHDAQEPRAEGEPRGGRYRGAFRNASCAASSASAGRRTPSRRCGRRSSGSARPVCRRRRPRAGALDQSASSASRTTAYPYTARPALAQALRLASARTSRDERRRREGRDAPTRAATRAPRHRRPRRGRRGGGRGRRRPAAGWKSTFLQDSRSGSHAAASWLEPRAILGLARTFPSAAEHEQ